MKTFLCFLVFSGNVLMAQDLKWYEGSVVLKSGTVVTGEIHLAPGQNLILFREGHQSGEWREERHQSGDWRQRRRGTSLETGANGGEQRGDDWQLQKEEDCRQGAEVLPAHKLTAVYFYDEAENINRRFIAIGEQAAIPSVQLYEVVLKGHIDVLRKPRTLTSASTEAADFAYYCQRDNKLMPLWKFHREIFPLLDDHSQQQVAAYVKANGLQRGNDANVIRIISYYNKLVRAGQVLARY